MSLCFLSLKIEKVFNKILLEKLKNEGFDGLSEALIALFPYIDEEMMTSSKLSKKVGYSRQAVHKHIKKMQELGYIILKFENQKEKSIKLTQKGEKLIKSANLKIKNIEKNLEDIVGKNELYAYKINQGKIFRFLEDLV